MGKWKEREKAEGKNGNRWLRGKEGTERVRHDSDDDQRKKWRIS